MYSKVLTFLFQNHKYIFNYIIMLLMHSLSLLYLMSIVCKVQLLIFTWIVLLTFFNANVSLYSHFIVYVNKYIVWCKDGRNI